MGLTSLSGHALRHVARNLAIVTSITALGGYATQTQAATSASLQWPVWGGSPLNQGYAPNETKLSAATVPNLKQKWVFNTHGAVSSTPTVDGAYLYATDWKGYIYKLNLADGTEVWEKDISTFTGKRGSTSRNSPAITDTALIFGDQSSATVIAIDKNSGAKMWTKSVETDGSGLITDSPMVYNNVVYVGVASIEEATVLFEGKKGPQFRGSVWALKAGSGEEIWHQNTVPPGYTGGGVWSSPIVVDAARGSIYLTTGDNYSLPADVATCVNNIGANQDPTDPATLAKQVACLAPGDYVDSVVAYDMNNGNVKWARRLQGADAWTAYCILNAKKCPVKGVDWDFGSGVNLISATASHPQLVGAGQKNGIYWALDPDTGATVWSTLAGPPSLEGGIEWGSATDNNRVYIAEANFTGQTFKFQDGTSWDGGSWAALDLAHNGKILWQTKATKHKNNKKGTIANGALTVANGVVYAGTLDGDFVALEASSGNILWRFASGGSVVDSPSIVDGVIYWGSGYSRIGHANNQIYAFTVP